jgi:RNA polymerase sigma-70 factor (ECF subfamily)
MSNETAAAVVEQSYSLVPSRCSTNVFAAARGGSSSALGELLESFRRHLLLIASAQINADVRSKAEASDLVQETFLDAVRDFSNFRGSTGEEFLAWLCRILHNNLAEFHRHYQRTAKRQVSREQSLQTGCRISPRSRQRKADETSPSVQLIRREQSERLDEALARLGRKDRRIIELRHHVGLSFLEIGRVVGCSPDAARMAWWRAVDRLACALSLLKRTTRRDDVNGYVAAAHEQSGRVTAPVVP